MADKPSFGSILDIFKEIFMSGPVDGLTKWADRAATVGQFFGWVDPKTKSFLDFARSMQDYAHGRITRDDLVHEGIQATASALITGALEKNLGWSPEIASIAGFLGKKVISMITGGLGVEHAISGIVGMVTGAAEVQGAGAPGGGKGQGTRGAAAGAGQ